MKTKTIRWLRRLKIIRAAGDKYSSFAELQAHEKDSSYSIQLVDRGSPITIMAIHGGGIEPGTSQLTKALAGTEFNYYCFNATKLKNNWDLHITSDRFDEPQALALANKSKFIVTLHGCMGRGTVAYTGGGLATQLRQSIENKLESAGIASRPHPVFNGRSSANICNQGQQPGLQLELTPALRLSPLAYTKRRKFVETMRKVLKELV